MNLSLVVFQEFQALALTVVCLVGNLLFHVGLAFKATRCQGQAAEGSENLLNLGTKVRQHLLQKTTEFGARFGSKSGANFGPRIGVHFWPPYLKVNKGANFRPKKGATFWVVLGVHFWPPRIDNFLFRMSPKMPDLRLKT